MDLYEELRMNYTSERTNVWTIKIDQQTFPNVWVGLDNSFHTLQDDLSLQILLLRINEQKKNTKVTIYSPVFNSGPLPLLLLQYGRELFYFMVRNFSSKGGRKEWNKGFVNRLLVTVPFNFQDLGSKYKSTSFRVWIYKYFHTWYH